MYIQEYLRKLKKCIYKKKGAPPHPNLHDVEKNIYNKLTE